VGAARELRLRLDVEGRSAETQLLALACVEALLGPGSEAFRLAASQKSIPGAVCSLVLSPNADPAVREKAAALVHHWAAAHGRPFATALEALKLAGVPVETLGSEFEGWARARDSTAGASPRRSPAAAGPPGSSERDGRGGAAAFAEALEEEAVPLWPQGAVGRAEWGAETRAAAAAQAAMAAELRAEADAAADPEVAVRLYTEALNYQAVYTGYAGRAAALLRLGRRAEAAADAAAVLELAPAWHGGYGLRGRVHQASGAARQAQAFYERAAKLAATEGDLAAQEQYARWLQKLREAPR